MRAGLIIVARRCETDAEFDALQREVRDAAIIESDDGKVWRAMTQLGDANFEVARDIVNHLPLARRINGREMRFEALAVNGRSLWPQTLAPRAQTEAKVRGQTRFNSDE